MNRIVEKYLRCYFSSNQDDWDGLLTGAEFIYNSAVSDDLGTYPFEVELTWKINSPIDLMTAFDYPVESVEEFKSRMKTSLESATFAYEVAKASQSPIYSKKYMKTENRVGE